MNHADSIKAHPYFDEKYKNTQDTHNQELAFEKMFEEVMLKNRRDELDLYKLLLSGAAFKAAMQQSLRQLIS
jgi:type I restriction enzyme R subunit